MAPYPATVLITTKNRRDELRNALHSVFAQSITVEVLVIDDGSNDGTFEMVRAEFPAARVVRHEQSQGLIARRNEGVTAASANIVISIDDDAALSSTEVVCTTLKEFDDDRIGAVAIPYVDVNRDPQARQRAPAADTAYATDRFIGTAHALRRDVFLRVGGYRDGLVHQGEEGDYCLRMLDAGFVVRLGNADPIHHFESPRRDFRRMDYFGARNAVVFVWQNVSMPYLLWHWPAVIVRVFLHTLQPVRLWTRASGLAAGLVRCFTVARVPVSRQTYLLSRHLAARPQPISAVPRLMRASGA